MGVDKDQLCSRCTKTFKGHFLKSQVTNSSIFKAELLSLCSSTVVYDIQFSSSVSTFSNVKNNAENVKGCEYFLHCIYDQFNVILMDKKVCFSFKDKDISK